MSPATFLSVTSSQWPPVLEFGAYTGYSALAWYEGTVGTGAEITTLELDPSMVAATRRTLERYGIGDRVTLIEAPAQETVQKLEGTFDLIFVDANKDGYDDLRSGHLGVFGC